MAASRILAGRFQVSCFFFCCRRRVRVFSMRTMKTTSVSQKAWFAAILRDDVAEVERMCATNPALLESRTREGLSPLILAIYRRRPRVIAFLQRRQAELSLFEAIALGHLKRVKEIVSATPAAANAPHADGWMPLHFAACYGFPAIVRFLISAGARIDVRAENWIGNTPLLSAMYCHSEETGRDTRGAALALVKMGAEPNIGRDRDTPLHLATERGWTDVARALLRRGADPHARDSHGNTPCERAAAAGHADTAKALDSAMKKNRATAARGLRR